MGQFKTLDTAVQELISTHGAALVRAAVMAAAVCKCGKCGNSWMARRAAPAMCPRCKSRRWMDTGEVSP